MVAVERERPVLAFTIIRALRPDRFAGAVAASGVAVVPFALDVGTPVPLWHRAGLAAGSGGAPSPTAKG